MTSIGYSLDNSTDTSAVGGTTLNTNAVAGSGPHALHVKSWGSQGASCNAEVTVNVTTSASPAQSLVPAYATTVTNIQNKDGWEAVHDANSGGGSSGSMTMVGSPSMSGHARRFDTSFSGSGGELYNTYFDSDVNASNFFYDGWVYLTSSAANVANLEMDMNQVLGDGTTIIFGFQCDGYSGTWDYTTNRGTPTKPIDRWEHANASCDPRKWGRNQWHHIQVSYSRDDGGNVIYHSVFLDGAESKLEVKVPSAFMLGWAPALITNFQVDGKGSGSNSVLLDQLSISRW